MLLRNRVVHIDEAIETLDCCPERTENARTTHLVAIPTLSPWRQISLQIFLFLVDKDEAVGRDLVDGGK